MDYTKGTWERHNAPNGEHLWAGEEHIADFDGPHASGNAKLCVAAPDLLDALESLYEWIDECFPEYRPDELMAKAERAAAKAGQTTIIQSTPQANGRG